jgi:hypothetical protein
VSRTTTGHLLIADIGGFAQNLSSSELEHAQKVVKSLVELLIDLGCARGVSQDHLPPCGRSR